MVDTYYHSHEVDEVVIGSFHSDEFTCTQVDTLTCASGYSGIVRDQSIIPPASSAEYNVHFADDVNVASLYETENYLTATTFRSISSQCGKLANTILGLESAKKIEDIGELRCFINKYGGGSVLSGEPILYQ